MQAYESVGQAPKSGRPPDVKAPLKPEPASHEARPAPDRKPASRKARRPEPKIRHYGAGF